MPLESVELTYDDDMDGTNDVLNPVAKTKGEAVYLTAYATHPRRIQRTKCCKLLFLLLEKADTTRWYIISSSKVQKIRRR